MCRMSQTYFSFCLSPPRLSVGHVTAVHPEKAAVTIGQYLRQLSRHRNFLWFVSMNLIQVKCQKRRSCRCDSFETFHDQLLVLSETGCCVCPPCRCFTAISTTTSSLFSWSISSPTTSRPPRARSYWVNDSKLILKSRVTVRLFGSVVSLIQRVLE